MDSEARDPTDEPAPKASADPNNIALREAMNELDTDELFNDMFLEMEEILLDSGGLHQNKYVKGSNRSVAQDSNHGRDGSSTASTSGASDWQNDNQHIPSIEWVEVVGTRRNKGDVSFGERLVGVKEYTLYRIKVWSGKDHWEVERRYRDFVSLSHQLQMLYSGYNLALPPPWCKVDRESRKFFGNSAPSVVNDRVSLIQDCLRSILNTDAPFGTPSPLMWFLSPSSGNMGIQSVTSTVDDARSRSSCCSRNCSEDSSALGKTISLVVEVSVHKSEKQLLEEQRYTCAGCHRHLDVGNSRMLDFVQSLRWGRPRLCEYTGQLYCCSCHTNDTAILPAKVLHHWDFSPCPVSQIAKAYLESTFDQPMLCVSAVNPFLFSKVPALHHVMETRKKIEAMLPYIRCPFKRSIDRVLGSRSYLLENNDFFALKDLVDLSKGAFAALPVMVDTVSTKIFDHITQHCLVCYDVGISCGAQQACKEPHSSILSFQAAEAIKCSSCGLIFHEPCFKLLGDCPCRKSDGHSSDRTVNAAGLLTENGEVTKTDENSNSLIRQQDSRIFSVADLLSKAKLGKLWKRNESGPVILMGSIQNTSS